MIVEVPIRASAIFQYRTDPLTWKFGMKASPSSEKLRVLNDVMNPGTGLLPNVPVPPVVLDHL